MTTKQVDRYRIHCKTENTYCYTWNDSLPTTCPNDHTHDIDSNTISIVDSVSSSAVEVVQQIGTGGNYSCQSFCFDIPANESVTRQYSWPFPSSISSLHFASDATQVGDYVSGVISPNTPIGSLTAGLAATGKVMSVTPSATKNAITGTLATVTDGTNFKDLGYFFDIDATNNTVCVQYPPQLEFKAGSQVLMSFQNISLEIGQPGFYSFGSQQLKGASMPANAIIMVTYTNAGAAPKRFRCWAELGY